MIKRKLYNSVETPTFSQDGATGLTFILLFITTIELDKIYSES